jgi:hypothetical protein
MITFFKSVKDTGAPFIRDIHTALDRIKNGKSKDDVLEFRRTGDGSVKNKLTAVCFGGEFNNRTKKGCIKHSGFMVLDFDKFDTEENTLKFKSELSENEYIYSCWISPSGKGVKALVKIPEDINGHKYYFDAIREYFDHPNWDNSGHDICRVCFESYDPDLFLNEDSKIWTNKIEPELEDIGTFTPSVPVVSSSKIISSLLKWWEKKFGMVTGSRSNNLFKLASAFNDFGVMKSDCEGTLLQYEQPDFKAHEILKIIQSAYRNSANFGTKFFEDKPLKEKIEKSIRSGKNEKEIIKSYPELKKEDITKVIENVKDGMASEDFWEHDSKGKIKLSPYKFKRWLENENYFKYYPNKTSGFTFIYKDKNLLEETSQEKIKDYTLKKILQRENIGQAPYNFMASNTKYFHPDFLSLLDTADVNIKEDTADTSYLYYSNCVVEVKKDSIKQIDYLDIDGFVWKRQVIDRDFIQSDHHKSEFRRFIWLISGQDVSRYNSFKSVIGYLLHSYKTSANNRAIIFNDETISENPNGGSGKGLFWNALSKMKKVASIDGKNFEFTKSFPYQTVSADTQILVFDDVKKNFNFESLFSLITEGITLEYKGQDAIKLPVQRSPKIIITTNYTVGGIGGSFERRKFEVEMSTFFNANHSPLDEFGHMLFDDWDDAEWSRFDNYMHQCAQYYLTNGLTSYDFKNLSTRKFIKNTSFEFFEWVTDYNFSNRMSKGEVFNNFLEEYPDYKKRLTNKTFKKWIDYYCQFKNYKLTEGNSNGVRWFTIEQPKSELMPDHNDTWI